MEMAESIITEFEDVSLGDKRLNQRLLKIVGSLHGKPDEPFPNIFSEPGELEGFYRFLGNYYVEEDTILRPHVAATVKRANRLNEFLVLHDTTEFVFSGERDDLMEAQKARSSSFLGHASLAFSNQAEPLGVLRMKTWTRQGTTKSALEKQGVSKYALRDYPTQHARWFEGIQEASELFENPQKLIHVCDSEGDSYQLLSKIRGQSFRFVIRGCHNRPLIGMDGNLFENLFQQPILAERSVPVSKRETKGSSKKRHPARDSRIAHLEIRSQSVSISRPKTCSLKLSQQIDINAVYVRESSPPEGQQAVEWILLTSEPISSLEDVLKVVDIYRIRWGIEEYFKALKTGCSYESRQLESYHTLTNYLALCIPIAWQMLALRFASRSQPELPPEAVLSPPMLNVLRLHTKKQLKTSYDALMAVAQVGGHIKNNGQPGWMVLWRGFRKLISMMHGYQLAMGGSLNQYKNGCDQS